MTDNSSKYPVEALCTVVPDGISEDGKHRFSVVLSPYVAPAANDPSANHSLEHLTDLPLDTFAVAVSDEDVGRFVLFLHMKDGSIVPLEAGHDDAVSASEFDQVQTLWDKAFFFPKEMGANKDGFQRFHDVLADPNDRQTNFTSENDPLYFALPDPNRTQSFHVGQLAKPITDYKLALLAARLTAQAMSKTNFMASASEFNSTLSDIEIGQLEAIFTELQNRPFSTSVRKDMWLTTLSHVFLPRGTDSALGCLESLTSDENEQLFKAKNATSVVNEQVSALARQLAGDSTAMNEWEAVDESFAEALKVVQQPDSPLRLDAPNVLSYLLPLEFVEDAKGSSFTGLRTAANDFRDHILAYRDAHSFERAPRFSDTSDPQSDCDLTERELRDGVRRKMADLRARPTLSKALRLIHDFELPLSAYALSEVAFVSAAYLRKDASASDLSQDPKFQSRIAKTAVSLLSSTGKNVCAPRTRKAAIAELLNAHSTGAKAQVQHIESKKIGNMIADNGLIDLRAGGRFRLNILETSQMAHAMESRAQAISETSEQGATPQYTSFEMPQFNSRGIELLDQASQEEVVFDLTLAKLRRQTSSPQPDNCLYAEDLMAGIRVDIIHFASDTNSVSYHPSMSRRFKNSDVDSILKKTGQQGEHPLGRFGAREEGFASAPIRLRSNAGADDQTSPKTTAIATPRLLYWTGEPPGMPTKKAEVKDVRRALALDMTDEPPEEEEWPILREGDAYSMVARPRYVNGGGPEFLFGERTRTNANIYLTNALGAPDNPDQPLLFTPTNVVAAPEVLMTPNDPLLRPDAAKAVLPDKVTTVVIRSYEGAKQQPPPQRVVAVPHISFEQAEQQGQFDSYTGRGMPPGNSQMAKVDWDPNIFAYPFSEKTYSLDGEKVEVEDDPASQVRGPIFRGAKSGETRPSYYYIDTRINEIFLSLEDSGRVPFDVSDMTRRPVSFAHSIQSPQELPAVILSFFPEQDRSHRNWISEGLPRTTIRTDGHKTVSLNQLGVHVLPGAELELNLICPLPVGELFRTNFFARQFGIAASSYASFRGQVAPNNPQKNYFDKLDLLAGAVGQNAEWFQTNKQKLSDLARELFWDVPSDLFNAIEKISVIHAVQKPLDAPRIPGRTIAFKTDSAAYVAQKEQRAFRIVRRIDGPDEWATRLAQIPAVDKGNKGWSFREAWLYGIPSVNSIDGQNWAKAEHLEDQADGPLAYVVGEVELHRATTGKLRCDILFRDVTAPAAMTQSRDGRWVFEPKMRAQTVFELPNIQKLDPENDRPLDLTFDAAGAPRGLSWDAGTKARRIALRMVATSRFEEYFEENLTSPAEPTADTSDVTQEDRLSFSERENASFDGLKEALGKHNCPRIDKEKVLFEEEFWIKSTRRPPRPDVRKTEVLFEKNEVARSKTSIVIEQKSVVRIHLGDHYASGEGELIALVMLPDGLVSDYPTVCPANGNTVEHDHVLSAEEHAQSSALKDASMDLVQYDTVLGRSVAAWGSDPTTSSGFLSSVILPSQFAGWSMKKSGMNLPLIEDDELETQHNVSVMGFEPLLNPDTCTWHVDIEVDATRADSPFIRLPIVRCQLQSLRGLELSLPTVGAPIQVPPKRRVEVDISSEGQVHVIITGAGYSRRDPAFHTDGDDEVSDILQSRADVPLQNIQLMRRAGNDSYVQIYDLNGEAIERMAVMPVAQDTGMVWQVTLPMPQELDLADLRVTVFETELNVPDRGENEPVTTVIETTRPFTCDIDLEI